ncbi:MAG TPA: DMT family transporter [Polyangiales bacterium]|nr:DMT family transporter [Polyangiales bacterium]
MRDNSGRLALVLGLLGVATSGPFFVMSKLDPYAAVVWRTLIAGLLAVLVAWLRGALDVPTVRRHARGLLFSGLLLGPHFLLWVKAFDLTDYASNLLLLVAQPVSAAILDRLLGRSLPRNAALSLALALTGLLLVAGADISLGPRALLGDACVLTGFVGALFYVVGREARLALSMDTFMGVTFLIACATALPVALLAHAPLWGYAPESYAWLSALIVITTLGGHGLLNYASRTLSLFTVNIIIVLEPLIAILLGAWLFGASISWLQALGGLLLSAAVVPLLRSA